MIRIRIFLCFIAVLLLTASMQAQEIKSPKSGLWVNNKPKTETHVATVEEDKTAPEIKILSPEIAEGDIYKTEVPELNLLCKAIDVSGISYVAVNSKLAEVSGEGIFVTDLVLEEGENEIKLVAVDRENNMQDRTIIIEYYPPVVTLADRINEESTYYGLIIGVNKYDDPKIPDLDNPIQDAQSLYDVLTSQYTFEKENVEFLKDASLEDIMTSFEKLSGKITANDNLLVFYAGHGWWDSNANTGFWLPADSKQDSKLKWFRNSTLVDYLKEMDTKHTLLIADACFSGAIFKTRSAMPEASKAVEMLYDLPSRKAMTSGTLTEVPDKSAFIKYLVERLKNSDETYLCSEQLFSNISHAVINNSDVVPQYGEIQNVGDQGGDFIFIKK
ncbi:caspase family protein [Bacteroidota bacterium]